jgi:TRAP-type C4-dicarboxylate transport system permease small subunit
MGMLSNLGVNTSSIPSIDISGFISSSWIYIAVIVFFGFIFILALCIFLFFLTYCKKIVLFENIAGQGYQPILKTRARTIKLGIGGEELLKTLKGGHFVSAYGRKMGRNTYWYAKGLDGYWYNIILGDLDTKRGMLDIDPIDRDVRMFHVALDRLSHQSYGQKDTMAKIIMYGTVFIFLLTLILGMWFIVGKIGDATAPLTQSNEIALKISENNMQVTARLDSLLRAMGYLEENKLPTGSGIIPAT